MDEQKAREELSAALAGVQCVIDGTMSLEWLRLTFPNVVKDAEKAMTPPASGEILTAAEFIGDKRLMVDPSVPEDMVLFPDEKTRKWYIARPERLIDCLKSIRKHIGKMQDEKVKYDFNADPLYTTLIEGWINVALDTEEFCPDWMCQAECPASEALKEHLESAATAAQGQGWTKEEVGQILKAEWNSVRLDSYSTVITGVLEILAAKGVIKIKQPAEKGGA